MRKRAILQESVIDRFSVALSCEYVLHSRFDWRYICAMLIGHARVSTNEQDTAVKWRRSSRRIRVSIVRRPPKGAVAVTHSPDHFAIAIDVFHLFQLELERKGIQVDSPSLHPSGRRYSTRKPSMNWRDHVRDFCTGQQRRRRPNRRILVCPKSSGARIICHPHSVPR